MKLRFASIIYMTFFSLINILHCQPINNNGIIAPADLRNNPGPPVKQMQSPVFGRDIIIHDQPDQNQRQVALCSAFNGWLYAAYTYSKTIFSYPAIMVLISKDNGITWTTLVDIFDGGNTNGFFTSMDILVTGDSVANLKLFIAAVATNSPTGIGDAVVNVYNGATGADENQLFYQSFIHCIGIAGDFNSR